MFVTVFTFVGSPEQRGEMENYLAQHAEAFHTELPGKIHARTDGDMELRVTAQATRNLLPELQGLGLSVTFK